MNRVSFAAPAVTWLRGAAIIGAYGEAIAHIPVIPEHLREAPYIGVGFVLLAIAGIGLGQLLLFSDRPWVWFACGVVAVAALVGYGLSRSVGLPEIRDDIGDWTDSWGVLAISAESLMLVAVLLRWRAARHSSGRGSAPAPHRPPRVDRKSR